MRKAIAALLDSNAFFIGAMIALAIGNYGWIFAPEIGWYWGTINAAIILGIICAALCKRACDRFRS